MNSFYIAYLYTACLYTHCLSLKAVCGWAPTQIPGELFSRLARFLLHWYTPNSGFTPGESGPTPYCPQNGVCVCVKKSEAGVN